VLSAHLENSGSQTELTVVAFALHLGAGGPLALLLPVQVSLLPGEVRQVDLVLPVDVALHAALAGLTLDERVYVGASFALDSRRLVLPIP